MGHKTIQVTLRYAHLAPLQQLQAVERLCNTGAEQESQLAPKLNTRDLVHLTSVSD
jgi:hypothetical protein